MSIHKEIAEAIGHESTRLAGLMLQGAITGFTFNVYDDGRKMKFGISVEGTSNSHDIAMNVFKDTPHGPAPLLAYIMETKLQRLGIDPKLL